ncbi:MAG TPA: hypothetical protein VFS66_05980 [Acidimicrobiia bacterium]|nr:hypothetical protein [Acidimicrobiia bacterium]
MTIAVFIPAAMGLGVLFSVALLFDDLYRKAFGIRSARKRASLMGASTAAQTIRGEFEILQPPKGLRRTRAYWMTAAALLTLGAIALPGATWNYFNPGGYVEGIAFVWAISSVVVVFFLLSGVAVLHAAPSLLPWFVACVTVGYAIRLVTFLEFGSRVSAAVGIVIVGGVATVVARSWSKHHKGLPAGVWPFFVATSLTTDTRSGVEDNEGDEGGI